MNMENHYQYGLEYQISQANKYRNRFKNHWQYRIKLINDLVSKYSLPRLGAKKVEDIIVVDVGCSIGTFALEFGKTGYRSYGVDSDPMAIKLATELSEEEGVVVDFKCLDISEWGRDFPPIDIAICSDIFEHLHDDQLGSFLQAIKKQLSPHGSLVFHTFPTQYDYMFYGCLLHRFALTLFSGLSIPSFERIVKIYSYLYDIALKINNGYTYSEKIQFDGHCNPTTKQRLINIFERFGYEIIVIESSNLYPIEQSNRILYANRLAMYTKKYLHRQFSKQPITHRNLYGIAIRKNEF